MLSKLSRAWSGRESGNRLISLSTNPLICRKDESKSVETEYENVSSSLTAIINFSARFASLYFEKQVLCWQWLIVLQGLFSPYLQ